jgi:RES domain-containing protein
LTKVYRVVRKPYAHAPFDGEGAFRYGGRWSSPGTRLIYTSEHQSLAMLEYFVHLDADDPPPELMLAIAEVPDGIERREIRIEELPPRWRGTPAIPELSAIGDGFVKGSECAVLLVPSALAPSERNWLLNPGHADFKKVVVQANEPLAYDARLFPGTHRGRRRGSK